MCLLETKALNLLTCQDDFCGREKKDDRKIDFAANQVFDLTLVQVMLWSTSMAFQTILAEYQYSRKILNYFSVHITISN